MPPPCLLPSEPFDLLPLHLLDPCQVYLNDAPLEGRLDLFRVNSRRKIGLCCPTLDGVVILFLDRCLALAFARRAREATVSEEPSKEVVSLLFNPAETPPHQAGTRYRVRGP
jgi:hypothetical protein